MMMEIERFQRNAALLHSTVGGDVVALDVDRRRCFGLEVVGARIWDLLDQPVTVAAICATLTAEYDVDAATCAAEVGEFIRQAMDEGVVSAV
jgi:hypothetical protein